MVLIPYNAESFAQYTTNEVVPGQGTLRRQNVLEYQQVSVYTPNMRIKEVAAKIKFRFRYR